MSARPADSITTGAVDRARGLEDLIVEHRLDGDAQRRLPEPLVSALVDAGLMRLCVPAAYGGPEADPVTLIAVIEELGRHDGATAWCSMIASTTASMAAFLPARSAREIYGPVDVVTGGVFAPNGSGVAASRDRDDGFEVTGRWAWGSGTQHSHWVLGGARCDDDTFRLCWFRHDDVDFHDTWHSTGVRGSGSLDFSVDGVFVPSQRTIQPGVTRPVVDSAAARFPNFALLAASVAAVGLGVARGALDELVAVASGKRPQYSSRTLAESVYTQVEFARADAMLRAARAYLVSELASTWEVARSGRPVRLDERVRIRSAAVHAARTGAEVADLAYTLAGGTAVYESSPIGRFARDAHVVTQHIQTAPKLNETVGKVLLGVDADTRLF
ncbi:MAG: acyl-CoA dehydrogenase family protein [Acidimicrobiia bacterium]|nr:acyl-CoA dehydrogenase family protein [Acidimicrobiia bacterium]